MSANSARELQKIYGARFAQNLAYRRKVWNVLVPSFFQKYVALGDAVLDLGCGYGEFINTIRCGQKLAMDLNPDAPKYLDSSVRFLEQDCSSRWQVEDASLYVVFTSNFFEHLPDKAALGRTLDEIFRCLAPGGKLIAMGPNIKHLPGKYWDFWDHHLPLTEISLSEGLSNRGFEIVTRLGKFLPYTMVGQREYPDILLKLYLRFPMAWRIMGKQFLIIAAKPRSVSAAA
jgi:SAM-dependent methyltransferase